MRLPALLFWLSCAAGLARAAGPPASDLDVIRGTEATDRFERAIEPRVFEFPRDHGPHPEFRHEWWYVTGNLDSTRGERFGFELTFFRFALAPPAARGPTPAGGNAAAGAGSSALGTPARSGESAWRTRQVYAAHFAVTDVARGEFSFAQKRSRGALGLAGAQSEPFRVWLDDWVLGSPARIDDRSASVSPSAPADRTPSADWTVHARGHGYELTLEARPLLQPVPNGERGLSRKSAEPGAASYYYSIPRIAVHGTLAHGGATSEVEGLAWLDREWGSGSLGERQQGWDWFALQLQDGSALMFYVLRNADGSRDPHSSGTWIDPTGRARALTSGDVSIDVIDHWVSPRGGRYPSRWRVRVASVGLDLEVRPVQSDQELGTRPRYWEGAVDLRGGKDYGEAKGRGYVELVGYGE